MGLFGVAEILLLVEGRGAMPQLPAVRARDLYPTRHELRRAVPAMFRGGALGVAFGLIPGPGGAVSTYASYMLERRLSPHADQFGQGAIEGVAAGPESANNGTAGGSLVPLLVLGVPFAAPAALLLAGRSPSRCSRWPWSPSPHPRFGRGRTFARLNALNEEE